MRSWMPSDACSTGRRPRRPETPAHREARDARSGRCRTTADGRRTVAGLLALQGLVFLGNLALEPAHRLAQLETADRVTREINLRIHRKVNSLVDISFFESPRFYDLLQRAQQEAGWRPTGMM